MESTTAAPLRSQAASAAIVLLGYSAPLYALPIYSRHHPEARCAYSLLVLVVWTLMQVLPAPVACMFPPLVLAASDTIGEDDAIAGYTSVRRTLRPLAVLGTGDENGEAVCLMCTSLDTTLWKTSLFGLLQRRVGIQCGSQHVVPPVSIER